MLVVGSVANLVEEVLTSIRVNAGPAPLRMEEADSSDLTLEIKKWWGMQDVGLWLDWLVSATDQEDVLQVDWMIAAYIGP